MLAMQYRFTLPADYDMAIVRRRIANFGHRLDACPQLIVKAYLYAQRSEGSAENLYAPFYLWNSSAGMSDFLTDEGFRGSARRSAGRVSIIGCRGWRISIALIWPGPPGRPVRSRLSPLQRSACAASATAGGPSALASIVAFDPADWRLVRLDLWREPPQSPCKTASCSASAICPPL